MANGAAQIDAGQARLDAGDSGAAIDLFTRAIMSKDLSPEDLAVAYYRRGAAYFKHGEAGRAILNYTIALWNHDLPRDYLSRTLNNRGLAYESIGEFDPAMGDYNLAIKINPRHAEPYANRGNLLRRNNRHEAAVSDFNNALRNGHPHPKYVFAWQGLAFQAQGRRVEAIAAFTSALQRDQNFELALTELKKLERSNSLRNFVSPRRQTSKPAAPIPVVTTVTRPRSADGVDAQQTPWTPPVPASPGVLRNPETPASNGVGLRPAIEDSRIPETPVVEEPARPKVIHIPSATKADDAPAPAAPAAPSNGEGGSDTEYAIQLGSFPSANAAERAWTKVSKLRSDPLNGLERLIEEKSLPDKGTVFRLLARSMPDRDSALKLCRTLRDHGSPCIVVKR